MAKENGAPSAAEKGKAKEETPAKDGQKNDDSLKKDKDGKPLPNGDKKGEEPEEGPDTGKSRLTMSLMFDT